jgi:hypothetical protein
VGERIQRRRCKSQNADPDGALVDVERAGVQVQPWP